MLTGPPWGVHYKVLHRATGVRIEVKLKGLKGYEVEESFRSLRYFQSVKMGFTIITRVF